jgi:hypothetical protein
LREDRYTIYIISRSVLFKIRNVSGKRCGEKTHFFVQIIYFFENRAVYEMMWENIVELSRPQVTTWDMRIALDTEDYKHTLRIRNTYYFYMATMVKRTRLNVTLYVHCLSRVSFLPVNRKYYSHVK